MGDFMFLIQFFLKEARNLPTADKEGFYVCNLILLKSDPKSAEGR
jgi:hypothetical protein